MQPAPDTTSPPQAAGLVEAVRLLRKLVRLAKAQASAGQALIDHATLANMLSVSPRKLDQLLSSGRVPKPLRLGRARRWRRDEITKWIDAGCPPVSTWQVRRNAADARERLAGVAGVAPA
jgi:predicted DNA-binding transcriptional regulator AlpA